MREPSPARRRLSGLALAGALVLGCGSGSSQPPAIDDSTGLASGLAQAFCTQQATCCGSVTNVTPDDGGGAPDGGPDAGPPTLSPTCPSDAGAASSCADRAALALQQQLSLISTALSEGLLTIDPNVADACINAYQNRACASTIAALPDVQAAVDDPACAGLFTGYIPIGERCDMTAECTAGSFCLGQTTGQSITSITGAGTLGICFAYQESGAPCNSTADCDPAAALTCNPTSLVCE